MALKKNAAAVALGRKGGLKGGRARAAKLTPEQRSASARQAVMARWAKANPGGRTRTAGDNSDQAVLDLLKRIKATDNPTEIRKLSHQLERVIFHKQFANS
jgi:hypothetical protein